MPEDNLDYGASEIIGPDNNGKYIIKRCNNDIIN